MSISDAVLASKTAFSDRVGIRSPVPIRTMPLIPRAAAPYSLGSSSFLIPVSAGFHKNAAEHDERTTGL
jgi:hypothetical protein